MRVRAAAVTGHAIRSKKTGEVVVIGRQGDQITADDIAKWTGTIAYEVLCTIGPRVPRFYHEG